MTAQLQQTSLSPPRQRSLRTLGDGLPPLLKTVSKACPSVPPEDQHKPVKLEVKKFGLLTEEAWESIKHATWQLFTVEETGAFTYCSENDIAGVVTTLLLTMIEALHLKANVSSQAGTFSVRPDLWVLTLFGAPVGVVDVKKPDIVEKTDGEMILDQPTVLGELYDFMLQLPNFYGVKPVFGILATIDTWRICWLPSETVATDKEAGKEESLPLPKPGVFETPTKAKRQEDGDGSPPGTTSKKNLKIHVVEEDDAPKKKVKKIKKKTAMEEVTVQLPRVVHASVVYRWNDQGAVALRAVASVLCKMARATFTSFADPFDKLDERTVLCFEKGVEGRVFWDHVKHLSGKGEWDKYANPVKYLYAIEDLGRGADGRVWLTCSDGGAVCVLKFPNDPSSQQI